MLQVQMPVLLNILSVSWVLELNVLETDERTATQYSCSNSSLPTVPSEGTRGVGQVASWAVSFERLLEDPMGVRYFTVSELNKCHSKEGIFLDIKKHI